MCGCVCDYVCVMLEGEDSIVRLDCGLVGTHVRTGTGVEGVGEEEAGRGSSSRCLSISFTTVLPRDCTTSTRCNSNVTSSFAAVVAERQRQRKEKEKKEREKKKIRKKTRTKVKKQRQQRLLRLSPVSAPFSS